MIQFCYRLWLGSTLAHDCQNGSKFWQRRRGATLKNTHPHCFQRMRIQSGSKCCLAVLLLVEIYLEKFLCEVVWWYARTKKENQMVSTLYSSNPATLVGFEPGISFVFSCLCVFPFLFLSNPTLTSIYVALKL